MGFGPLAISSLFGIILLLLVSSHPTTTVSAMTTSKMLLEGKRVLVTGGGRGIGRAIALICSKQGAQVAITSRTRLELEETSKLSKSKITNLFEADVTNPHQVDSMVQDLTKSWGGLDILINNAGAAQRPKGSVDTLDSQDLQNLLQVNVIAPQIVTSAVLKHAMPKDGRILNISSKAGKVGLSSMSFYVASKFALEGLTSSWSKELYDRNIIVNSISPGMIDTQSFPKPPDKPGVRTAQSIEDCLLLVLTTDKEYTGHYIHVDELDMVREAGLPDTDALKPIDEPSFSGVIAPPSSDNNKKEL